MALNKRPRILKICKQSSTIEVEWTFRDRPLQRDLRGKSYRSAQKLAPD
jgi:hypothetical protein